MRVLKTSRICHNKAKITKIALSFLRGCYCFFIIFLYIYKNDTIYSEKGSDNMGFDNITYNSYLNGDITLTNMLKQFGMSEYDFRKYTAKNGLKYRREFLKETTRHDFFDNIDSEIKAYLLGFYFADGCINDGDMIISITESDKEIVEYFKENISPHRKISISEGYENKKTGYTSKKLATITIHSEHLCETLTKYGMGKRKTTETTTDLSMIPQKYMLDFIRGYFDGDGTVCMTNGLKRYKAKDNEIKYTSYQNYNWSIISKKKEHLVLIQNFLQEEYGIHSNILEDKKGNYLIEINRKNDFRKIKDILYENKTYFLKRKHDKFLTYVIPEDKPKILKKKNGIVVKTYNSLAEAGRDENITPQGIKVRIKKNLNINGYTWCFE